MAEVNKYSRTIADYMYDDMNEFEKTEFESSLLENEDLKDEFSLHLKAVRYLKAKILLEDMKSDPNLKEAEKLVEKSFEEEKYELKTSRKGAKSILSIKSNSFKLAIAAVAVIGLISLLTLQQRDPFNKLYKDYYSPFDETSNIYRGENTELNELISEGIHYYSAKEYTNSYDVFKNIEAAYPENPVNSFYLGLSCLALDKTAAAQTQFEKHLATTSILEPETKWYLCLSYLKLDKADKAYQLLNELKTYQGKLGHDAENLSRKLERSL